MLDDKIFNNSYDEVEYGTECLAQTPIAVSPLVADRYEENYSEDIASIMQQKYLDEYMEELYLNSEFYAQFGRNNKRLDKSDMINVYYAFRKPLLDHGPYNILQVFCTIAEFFELNYKTLYNDIISLEDKAAILEIIEERYGLNKHLSKSKRLF